MTDIITNLLAEIASDSTAEQMRNNAFKLEYKNKGRLAAALDEEYNFKRDSVLLNDGFSSSSLYAEMFVDQIFDLIGKHHLTPGEVTRLMQKLLTAKEAESELIITLIGPVITSTITLDENTRVMRFADLRESRQKKATRESSPFGFPIHFSMANPPTAALIRKTKTHEACTRSPSESQKTYIQHQALPKFMEEAEELAAVMAVLGPSAVVIGPWWHEFVDPELEQIAPVTGPAHPIHELLPFSTINLSWFDQSVGQQSVLQNYKRLPATSRTRLRSACQRLNAALSKRTDYCESAVDLCTALETLLVANDGGEISYKLALRAAIAVGGSTDEKLQTRNLVRDLTDLRNARVHGGKSMIGVPDVERDRITRIVGKSYIIVATTIRNLIESDLDIEWKRSEIMGSLCPSPK